ncbi:hypothetical protein CPB86DRAFT_806881 [Serendipita vermifera]|nr:hypothetical protein CPB86DRAFT_806881 [Serendipita vermifera]
MEYSSSDQSPTPPRRSSPSTSTQRGILYASFRAPGASTIPGIDNLFKYHPGLFKNFSIPANYQIAITLDPKHASHYLWTFVPLAHGPAGAAQDDDLWPKSINVLGEVRELTLTEWDEYKSDPNYWCYIPDPPNIPFIVKSPQATGSGTTEEATRPGTRSPTPFPKRPASEAIDPLDTSPRKRTRTYVEDDTDTETDGPSFSNRFDATKSKLKREQDRQTRTQRHGRSASFQMGNMANDLPSIFSSPLFQFGADTSSTQPPPPKEKFAMETDPVQVKRPRQSADANGSFMSSKRPRYSDQGYVEDSIKDAARAQREFERQFNSWRRRHKTPTGPRLQARENEKDFWQNVNFEQFKGKSFAIDPDTTDTTEVKPDPSTESNSRSPPIWVGSEDESTGESDFNASRRNEEYAKRKRNSWGGVLSSDEEREARLEESRRKMEEINTYERRAKEADARKAAEEKRRQQRMKEEEERMRKEKERLRAAEEAQRRNAERQRARNQDGYFPGTGFDWSYFNQYSKRPDESRKTNGSSRPAFTWWESGGSTQRSTASTSRWGPQQALERYNRLAEAFDSFKATPERPLPSLDELPWPVLFAPGFTIDQVDWTAVEKFFEQAERLMGGKSHGKTKWKEFLKTSTRRFHPDRWRARGFIGEKGYGSDVEEKVNHVAKVLTPLYRATD